MSKIKLYLSSIIVACLFASCNKEEVDTSMLWGETKYYPGFLFYDYEPIRMSQTLCFETNEELKGKDWKTKFGLFKMTSDGSYVPVGNEVILYKNGDVCLNNILEITSKDEEVELGIEFAPNAPEGVHKWFLKVVDNGGFDRINEYTTTEDSLPLLLEWKAEKKDVLNPLLKGIIITLLVILSLLLVWFCILKNMFYPTFKIGNIQFVGGTYFSAKRIYKARKLVVTSSNEKQGTLNRWFTGKIVYEHNEMWSDEWELLPKGKKARAMTKRKYIFTPFVSSLEKQVEYQIEHLETGKKVNITLM